MKRLVSLLFSLILILNPSARADEGMWLPILIKQLNIKKMHEMGLNLSAEEIYSINRSSLKDAIPIFGGGCTSEIISDQGLLMTNLHCGYRQVQSHTTLENDYLKNGFWAMTRGEELPNPGLSVTFLIRMEDVTEKVLEGINDKMPEEERGQKIRSISAVIERDATDGTHYEAIVRSYYGGNQYYLLVFERYLDVRLVGAPPVSIGDFGSLTDNWMWPRHKADFALFRVYMSPDGKPAEYAPENIPLKPKHYLPVSNKGIEKGDFAMIMGYPGSTNRYMTSYGIKELMEVTHPNRIKIRGEKLILMNEDMNSDPEIRIQYAAKYKGASNYWKYSIGQTQGLKRLKVLEKKITIEEKFREWINADPERKAKYGEALDLIEKSYTGRREFNHAYQYLRECLLSGSELISFAANAGQLIDLLEAEEPDQSRLERTLSNLGSRADRFFRDYNPPTDKKITHALFKMYMEDISDEFYPESFSIITEEYQGDISHFIDDLFSQSMFADQSRFDDFIKEPDAEMLKKDLAVRMALPIFIKNMELRQKNN
ncbi:MAG: S46 family peptidase, partial [Bacteroidales bacterium]